MEPLAGQSTPDNRGLGAHDGLGCNLGDHTQLHYVADLSCVYNTIVDLKNLNYGFAAVSYAL